MSEERRSVIGRYWPVLVVVAVAAVALGVGALGGGDDGDAASSTGSGTATTAESTGAAEGPPALAAFEGQDPLSAPDCDPETGRLMIPMVYAPNCVPLWDDSRDNGGATYPGVTADEIKVVIYDAEANAEVTAAVEDAIGRELTPEEENAANREKVFEAMNALWETYGRTVVFEMLAASGAANDDAAAKADAIRAAEEMDAFAVIGGPTGTKAFAEELAARQVICLCAEGYPQEAYERWSPYVYSASIGSDLRYTYVEDLVESLAGKPAEYGGDAVKDVERKFALVHYETVDEAYGAAAEAFVEEMASRGIDVDRLPYVLDLGTAQETAGTMVARMKSDGVTSIVFSGDPFMPYFLATEATSQDWFPEWVITGTAGTDTAVAGRRYPQDQWSHAFGLSTLLARVRPEAADPNDNFVAWYLGEELSTYPQIFTAPTLFTGIQLAGPDLTPETFRAGLFSWKPTGGFITNWGLSFGSQLWDVEDHTGADDVVLVWWDPTAEGPHEAQEAGESGAGLYRYLDGGRRYSRGELAGVSPTFFDPSGTVTLLDERPPADQAPDYPRRTGRTDAASRARNRTRTAEFLMLLLGDGEQVGVDLACDVAL